MASEKSSTNQKEEETYIACGTHAQVFSIDPYTIEKRFNKRAKFDHETEIYSMLKGEWFPKVKGFTSKSILMERFDMELFLLLAERHEGRFTEERARVIIKLMVEAVAALHELGIAHLDIKLENFLVNIHPLRLVIADFDTATSDSYTNAFLGTVQFMAPEVLNCYFNEVVDYDSKKSDMWSLALAIFIVLVGYPPVNVATIQNIEIKNTKVSGCRLYYYILNEDWSSFWSSLHIEHISTESKLFLQRLLCSDPDKRMTASDLLSHPWFAGPECTSL
jgi:serine/threonine protein kinase